MVVPVTTPDPVVDSEIFDLNLVVKVAERCNLDCSYCYMYRFEDGWRTRPKFLSDEHTSLLVERVMEYLQRDTRRRVVLELHGGEPLLWGRQRFDRLIQLTADARAARRVEIVVQTNGVLLDEDWIDFLVAQRVPWSISCDGPAEIHNLFRPLAGGGTNAAQVEEAIRRSVPYMKGDLFGGVLTVANLVMNPYEIMSYFHGLGVRAMDFLLPDRTHLTPVESAWSRWLVEAFDAWLQISDPDFEVRCLHEIAMGVLGVPSDLDSFGGEIRGLLTIESDGSIQKHDVLRICGTDATVLGAHLSSHSLWDAVELVSADVPALAAQCRSCRALKSCGGGYLPHRWDGTTFENPSAYCQALLTAHDHITARLASQTRAELWKRTQLTTPP